MPTITCSNEECGAKIEFDISQLEIEESQPSGKHTTERSASGYIFCKTCNTDTEVNCAWDEFNETGEILELYFK